MSPHLDHILIPLYIFGAVYYSKIRSGIFGRCTFPLRWQISHQIIRHCFGMSYSESGKWCTNLESLSLYIYMYIAVPNCWARAAGGFLCSIGCSKWGADYWRQFSCCFGSLFSKLVQFSKKNIHFRNIIRDSDCGICRIISELNSSALWNVDFMLMITCT